MKLCLILSISLLSSGLFGQNKFLSLGTRENGICFGNSSVYNGIRLNLKDLNTIKVNGISLAAHSVSNRVNGISAGILVAADSFSNGFKIGGLVARVKIHNGLILSSLGITSTKLNGVGVTGLILFGDTLNGLFIGPFGVMPPNTRYTVKIINGFAIGGGVIASTMNGVAVAYFLNKFDTQNGLSIAGINLAKELHGFQFGLINCALNNRRLFRWTPLFNFNLRKKVRQSEPQ